MVPRESSSTVCLVAPSEGSGIEQRISREDDFASQLEMCKSDNDIDDERKLEANFSKCLGDDDRGCSTAPKKRRTEKMSRNRITNEAISLSASANSRNDSKQNRNEISLRDPDAAMVKSSSLTTDKNNSMERNVPSRIPNQILRLSDELKEHPLSPLGGVDRSASAGQPDSPPKNPKRTRRIQFAENNFKTTEVVFAPKEKSEVSFLEPAGRVAECQFSTSEMEDNDEGCFHNELKSLLSYDQISNDDSDGETGCGYDLTLATRISFSSQKEPKLSYSCSGFDYREAQQFAGDVSMRHSRLPSPSFNDQNNKSEVSLPSLAFNGQEQNEDDEATDRGSSLLRYPSDRELSFSIPSPKMGLSLPGISDRKLEVYNAILQQRNSIPTPVDDFLVDEEVEWTAEKVTFATEQPHVYEYERFPWNEYTDDDLAYLSKDEDTHSDDWDPYATLFGNQEEESASSNTSLIIESISIRKLVAGGNYSLEKKKFMERRRGGGGATTRFSERKEQDSSLNDAGNGRTRFSFAEVHASSPAEECSDSPVEERLKEKMNCLISEEFVKCTDDESLWGETTQKVNNKLTDK